MANHASARKRNRQSQKRKVANHSRRAEIRTLVRKVREAITGGDAEAARTSLHAASVAIAKAASKGNLHSANAARRTSRLAKQVSGIQA